VVSEARTALEQMRTKAVSSAVPSEPAPSPSASTSGEGKAVSCTGGIQARAVAVSMDGHAGLLVPFTDDVQAFILVDNRMYVVAEWRPNSDGTVATYGGGQRLVEDYLSTMRLLPGGPAPSASIPRPS
jgi:hypothetical protein